MSYWEHDDAIRSMIRRFQVLNVDDSGTQQILDLAGLYGEKPKRVLRVLPHGFTSNPPAGSDGLGLALGGRSDRLAYLDGGHEKHRPKNLPQGGAAIYDAYGKIIKVIEDETEIDAGGKPVVIHNASKVTIEADTEVVIGLKNKRYLRVREHRIDLAVQSPTEDAPYKVSTEGGPSEVLWARID